MEETSKQPQTTMLSFVVETNFQRGKFRNARIDIEMPTEAVQIYEDYIAKHCNGNHPVVARYCNERQQAHFSYEKDGMKRGMLYMRREDVQAEYSEQCEDGVWARMEKRVFDTLCCNVEAYELWEKILRIAKAEGNGLLDW